MIPNKSDHEAFQRALQKKREEQTMHRNKPDPAVGAAVILLAAFFLFWIIAVGITYFITQ